MGKRDTRCRRPLGTLGRSDTATSVDERRDVGGPGVGSALSFDVNGAGTATRSDGVHLPIKIDGQEPAGGTTFTSATTGTWGADGKMKQAMFWSVAAQSVNGDSVTVIGQAAPW